MLCFRFCWERFFFLKDCLFVDLNYSFLVLLYNYAFDSSKCVIYMVFNDFILFLFTLATNCSNPHRPVVFQARLSSTIYPLGSNQIITYDSTVINEGNAYDTLTGMFEANVGGLYQFMATMWSNNGYNVDFQMIFNGAEVCAGRTTTTNQSMGICSAILQIPDGGRVFVRHKGTSGNYARGGNYAEFAGHLIM